MSAFEAQELIRLASLLGRVLWEVVTCRPMMAKMSTQPLGVVGRPGGAGCKGKGSKIDSPWCAPWGMSG